MFLYASPQDEAPSFAALIACALLERAFSLLTQAVPPPLLPIIGPPMLMDVQTALAGATFDVVKVCDCDGNEDVLACERCGAVDVHFDVDWPKTPVPFDFLLDLIEPNIVRVPIIAVS